MSRHDLALLDPPPAHPNGEKNAANEGYAKLVELVHAPHARAFIVHLRAQPPLRWWISNAPWPPVQPERVIMQLSSSDSIKGLTIRSQQRFQKRSTFAQ